MRLVYIIVQPDSFFLTYVLILHCSYLILNGCWNDQDSNLGILKLTSDSLWNTAIIEVTGIKKYVNFFIL